MKVCLVVSDFAPRVGGIATFNNTLAHALSLRNDIEEVFVLSLNEKTYQHERLSDTLLVHRIPRTSFLKSFFLVLKELGRAKDFDVFHSPNIFPAGFFMLLASWIYRVPTVITFHGTDILSHEGSIFTRLLKRYTILRATLATTGSKSTRRLVSAYLKVPESRFEVVYYPVPNHKKQRELGLRITEGYSVDDVFVLSVSNLVKRKGVDDLIRAISRVEDPHVKLLVVGDGPEREPLQARVKELGLESRVTLLGRVEDADFYYHVAHIFCLVSYFLVEEGDVEGLGIVLLEAQQHGLPVIGTKSGGIPEAIEDGKSGYLVHERDVEAIAQRIRELSANAKLRARMGEAGQEFIAKKFNPDHTAATYASLYAKL